MKNKVKFNPFLRIFVFVAVLVLIGGAASIVLFYYIFGLSEPEGLSLATWPKTFTDNFSVWLENDYGKLKIEDIAIERLDEYGLWLQVIDENGQEAFSHNKPEHYPKSYSTSELIALSTSTYEKGNTVFVNSFSDKDKSWNYIIGFPYAIGKYMLYYNGENVSRLSPVFRMGICLALGLIVLLVLVYGFWITRHLGRITTGIDDILLRNYIKLPQNGIFGEIYGELNKMDTQLHNSDKVQRDTEQARREWIANITHDLKTPLSPIKGYAELLGEGTVSESETVQEYGSIILKNADNVEKLVNDLKLTYQLDSGEMPYNPQEIRIIRYLRELVIDIVNDPAFIGRDIEFKSSIQEAAVSLDPELFRRAIGNIIINALTHNPKETKVIITVSLDLQKGISIFICDNGIGMSDTEKSELFNRYYRGINTREKPEGSGLGLAIAKQIVSLHGGDITVKSKLNEGTQFVIFLPYKK